MLQCCTSEEKRFHSLHPVCVAVGAPLCVAIAAQCGLLVARAGECGRYYSEVSATPVIIVLGTSISV